MAQLSPSRTRIIRRANTEQGFARRLPEKLKRPARVGLFGGIGRLRSCLQLVVDLIEQVLRLLSVTLHVPFIGLLGRNDFFISLSAEPLGGCEIRMFRGGNILLGRLGDGAPNQKQGAGKYSK
jgi:hypothetical protein